ncbi:MAG: 4Fe-4S binding protein [Candidatus Omnitrophica bacterium]|nr:4Fe-4S binding protein [Candidatus Omnitrophota bacterium]
MGGLRDRCNERKGAMGFGSWGSMKKLVLVRHLSQVFFLALFVYILWATTYPLKSAISSQALFIIDPLVMVFTSLSQRVFLPGLVFSVIMIFLTLILGRFFCGWICPMGTMVDLAGKFRPDQKKDLADHHKAMIRWPKFMILALIFFLALGGIQVAWVLDPIVIIARVISLNVIPAVTLAVDGFFQFMIQKFGLYGGFYDFYRSLKESLLGINVHFFSNSLDTLMFFAVICVCSLLILRLWCRMLCPLGACYALSAIPSLLERRVSGCTSCGKCVRQCRMGAIAKGDSYRKEECILCMDCVYSCPEKSTRFSWRLGGRRAHGEPGKGITRGQFLLVCGSVGAMLGLKNSSSFAAEGDQASGHPVIRPPGALPEKRFVNTCVRCGNCMKVCITNVLQPDMFESGVEGLWTPRMIPEIGYCEYNCKLCGEVCPTGAITKLALEEKKKWKVGLAEIDKSLCLSWKGQKDCIVCEEHCPISDKAIRMKEEVFEGVKMLRPYVDKELCNGCGICQNKCPVIPVRAVRVNSAIVQERM